MNGQPKRIAAAAASAGFCRYNIGLVLPAEGRCDRSTADPSVVRTGQARRGTFHNGARLFARESLRGNRPSMAELFERASH
jgi:hypothetical protein